MTLTAAADDPAARCAHCSRTTDLIEGDGPVVCQSCLMSLGQLAADPDGIADSLIARVWEAHADVVQPIRVGPRLIWDWIGWP